MSKCPYDSLYCLCQYCDECDEQDKQCRVCEEKGHPMWTKAACARFHNPEVTAEQLQTQIKSRTLVVQEEGSFYGSN